MRKLPLLITAVLLTGCGHVGIAFFSHSANAPVDIDHEEHHHLVLSNDYVRVYRVEVAPHESTKLHFHAKDYVWVSIGPADVTNAVQGKAPVKLTLADGDAHFTPGNFAHVATNDSSQPFRNYTIALQRNGSVQLRPGEDEHNVVLLNNGTVESLFVKDGVRAMEITLGPGASVSGPHLQRPHLLISVDPDDRRVEWSNGDSKPLANATSSQARFFVLEF